MATRRIARGRGASPVPIIVLSVLVIGLTGATIIFGLKVGDVNKDLEDQNRQYRGLQDSMEQRETEFRKYESLVGIREKDANVLFKDLRDKMQERHDVSGDPEHPTPYENMTKLLFAYGDRCRALSADVKSLKEQLAASKLKREDLERSGEATKKSMDEAQAAANTQIKGLQTKKEELERAIEELRRTSEARIAKLEAANRALDEKNNELLKEIDNLNSKLKVSAETIAMLRKPPKRTTDFVVGTGREPADGKIVAVEPDGEYAMIDIGRRDWLSEGMEFRVYDDSTPHARKEKGRVQVRRVYDTIAQVKIIHQDPLDPILRDMVVLNPAFQRGRTLRFVFEGAFLDPNLKRILARYPCKIEDTVVRETDYLVLGDAKTPIGTLEREETDSYKRAREFGVRILTERDLARYLGER